MKNLHKQAIRCADLEGFDKILLKNRIIIALEERFDGVSGQLLDQIRAINRQEVLDNLLQQARQCPDIDSFKKILSQTN
ncbi:hypothetical protein BGP_0901 [Beggiatoa sp. PS]|nr:hypothetical protein BGP_0901 [Beggiatoa sp. PS]